MKKSKSISSGMTRRDFGKLVATLGALGYIDGQTVAMALSEDPRRLGYRAHRNAGAEGAWKLTQVEGEVPKELHGTLYRTAPGEKERFGVQFNHLFDGDAFVSGYSFRDGNVWLRANYIQTPERIEEQKAGKMIYSEFGTHAPGPGPYKYKNQANVNIIPFDGKLLGLSEGGHPTAIDPKTLAYLGDYDFKGGLSETMSFTAHPKYDPATGEAFGYGVEQGPTMALCVYRMEQDGTVTQLYKLPQPGYFMIHDMFISKDHIVFAIPPVKYRLGDMLTGKTTIGDALEYFEKEPLRFLILGRDGKSEPITVNQPASMVFHNGNAFAADGKLVVDSILTPNGSIIDVINRFGKPDANPYTPTEVTRLVIDLAKGEVLKRGVMGENQELPRFDIRRSGEEVRYLYALEGRDSSDFLANSNIVRHDLVRGTTSEYNVSEGRALGEAVYVPRPGNDAEGEGWLLALGYDGARDETFLEIVDAASLEFAARIWTGNHFPLGFHGNFVQDWFVQEA